MVMVSLTLSCLVMVISSLCRKVIVFFTHEEDNNDQIICGPPKIIGTPTICLGKDVTLF